ncbi:MAG: fibronectin type III domain-containing protein, partial [Acidobacteriota bacterium]|nr:fibronectin type III domain-containing protein [Acidobacteriota bacterium]
IVPQQPLNVGAKYQASVSGTDTQGNAFNVSWSFTTVPASGITSVIPFAGTPNSIWIQWTTAGAVQTTQLQFGTTTAYGMPLMGTPNNATNPNSYAANLTGLTPATTYHYQIAATDAQGNARTTADATFTTAAQ